MANFSIKFSYVVDDVTYHKTAIVRASNPEVAKDKVVAFYLSHHKAASSFVFDKVSLSSYNLIIS